MPSVSEKQRKTMAAAAHNPEFAKKLGIPVDVAKEYNQRDVEKRKADEKKKAEDKKKEDDKKKKEADKKKSSSHARSTIKAPAGFKDV